MTTANERIDGYLRRVRTGLRGLPDAEVTDILNELRAHIVERLELASGPRDSAVESVLQSFGRPEKIAALYVSENLVSRAESSRSPWTILRSLFYWSTLSVIGFVVFMICLIGYTFGVCFFLAALMKPIHPQGVGLWYRNDPANFSLHVGGFSGPAGQERELLGWWLVPVGCSLGGGTILLTTHFALWSLRRLRRSRRDDLS
jgi:hypothetical protein